MHDKFICIKDENVERRKLQKTKFKYKILRITLKYLSNQNYLSKDILVYKLKRIKKNSCKYLKDTRSSQAKKICNCVDMSSDRDKAENYPKFCLAKIEKWKNSKHSNGSLNPLHEDMLPCAVVVVVVVVGGGRGVDRCYIEMLHTNVRVDVVDSFLPLTPVLDQRPTSAILFLMFFRRLQYNETLGLNTKPGAITIL
ncbi:hypothetical protein GQX74_003060 [Glossina fuscipes]|nr:hypothetical protein GQX74_003060 [Glossina fuscipes]